MKIKLSLFIAFLAILSFTSCEDNPLEGTFVDEIGVESVNGSTNIGSGVSTGDYWPRAIGNQWTYDVSTGGSETWNMSNDIQVGGLSYYNMNQNNGVFGVAKQGASYFSRIDSNISIPGYNVTISPNIIVKFLQDDASIGTTWNNPLTVTYTYTPTAGGVAIPTTTLDLNYQYTIEDVGFTKTVNGQTYDNVIHVSSVLEVSGSSDVLGNVYYAKDVGVIENNIGSRELRLSNYTLN